jgi:TonB family protein
MKAKRTFKAILAVAFAAVCTNGVCQSESTDDDYTLDNKPKSTFYKTPDEEKEDNKVYTDVDKKPEFPGGYSALYKFIADHLKYPESAKMKRIQGKVLVRFIVGKQGNIENPEIMKGVAPDLDAEAIRVVKSLPKWIPGSHKGKNVRVSSTVSVNFKLDEQPTVNEMPKTQGDDEKEEPIFLIVEHMPQFPGGDIALREYIRDNVVYPEEAKAKKIQGKVFVQFVIGTDGNVEPESVKAIRSIDQTYRNVDLSLLDPEAIRVVKSMPKWEPGTQRGKPVRVSFTIPIDFSMY